MGRVCVVCCGRAGEPAQTRKEGRPKIMKSLGNEEPIIVILAPSEISVAAKSLRGSKNRWEAGAVCCNWTYLWN